MRRALTLAKAQLGPVLAGYLAPRHHATRACQMITLLGRLLRDGGELGAGGLDLGRR